MSHPADRSYTAEHEWLSAGVPATVGVTAFAADALGDVVYVDLPQPGAHVTAGRPCGEIESTKSVSDLYAPATGTVVDVNDALATDPALVNRDPYGEGWLFRLDVDDPGPLLDAAAYADLLS